MSEEAGQKPGLFDVDATSVAFTSPSLLQDSFAALRNNRGR